MELISSSKRVNILDKIFVDKTVQSYGMGMYHIIKKSNSRNRAMLGLSRLLKLTHVARDLNIANWQGAICKWIVFLCS